jgi:hypothetical protein
VFWLDATRDLTAGSVIAREHIEGRITAANRVSGTEIPDALWLIVQTGGTQVQNDELQVLSLSDKAPRKILVAVVNSESEVAGTWVRRNGTVRALAGYGNGYPRIVIDTREVRGSGGKASEQTQERLDHEEYEYDRSKKRYVLRAVR